MDTMLKSLLLVCGIVAMQLQYCSAEQKILIQKIKPGTHGRNHGDVEAVITGAELMANPRWISLEGDVKIERKESVIVIRPVQASDLEEGVLFRYTFAESLNKPSFKIETCQLKVVTGPKTGQFGFTYGTANFTLNDEKGNPVGLVGSLGTPPNQRENEFAVDMDDYMEKNLADVAMQFFGKIQNKFSSKFNHKLTGYKAIEGVITGVTMRKNRHNKDYLLIEYKSSGQAKDVIQKSAHPLYPQEKEYDVDLSRYTDKTFEEVARQFFIKLRGPFSEDVTEDADKPKEDRITSVVFML